MATAALGIVPLDVDDPSAPLGCAALRVLRGRPLLVRAVDVLTVSGVVPVVVVAVPPALESAVRGLLPAVAGATVSVLPVQANGPGRRLLASLRSPLGRAGAARDGDIVVVHDPLHPLSSAALVRDVVAALVAAPQVAGTAPARPVTDTLKQVDEDEVVRGTADREGHRVLAGPQAYRRGPLLAALEGASDDVLRSHGADAVPRLLLGRGATVRLVPLPGEAVRVASEDDLLLVEALLSADGVRAGGSGGPPAGSPPRRDRAGK